VVLDDKCVVGVESGQRGLVSCAWKDEAGVATFACFADKEYRKKIGLREAQKQRQRWRAGKPGLEVALAELPAPKRRTRSRCPGPSRGCFSFSAGPKWALVRPVLRFSQHFRRQRVMSEIFKRVASPWNDGVNLRPVAGGL
jgi:hypothetical protein